MIFLTLDRQGPTIGVTSLRMTFGPRNLSIGSVRGCKGDCHRIERQVSGPLPSQDQFRVSQIVSISPTPEVLC